MTLDWGIRIFKGQARSFSLANLPPRARSLWLPGDACLCVKEALALGVLDTDSRIIAVERDRATFAIMAATMRGLGFNHIPLLECRELSTVVLPFDLDLVNIDLCGSLTLDLAQWIERTLPHHLTMNASIIMTTRFGWRNNPFMVHAEERLLDDYRDLAEDVTLEIGSRHEKEVIPLLILMSALHNFVGHTTAIRYYDVIEDGGSHHQPMMLYRMDNIRHRTAPTRLPTLGVLLRGFEMSREAALKAWQTRRLKEKATKEAIEAATRKLQHLEYRRRALKAWETRRARETETKVD